MKDKFNESIQSLADEIRAQALALKVDTFLDFLYTSNIIDKYIHKVLSDEEVSRAGFTILHHLILHGGTMLPSEISRKTLRSKYAITRAIDTLQKQGYVERRMTPRDRRTRRIAITSEGLDIVRKATIDSRERMSRDILQMLTAKQTKDLHDILKIIRTHIISRLEEKEPDTR